VPIASYISGGLDSSTVATLAQRYLNRNIQKNLITISSVFPGSRIPDEQPYSDEVAHNIKSEHHRIMLPRKDFVKVHRDLIYVLDMPIAGYASPYRIMSSYVRKHVKVVLTGNGGDELFCGYPKYIAAVLAKEINDGLMGRTLTINARNIKYIKGFENQARQILGRNVFGNEEDIINSIFFRSEHLWKYVRPDIRRLAEGYSVTESMKEMCQTQSSSYLKKLLYLDFKLLLPGLLHVEDRTSMIENLESRTPLLDRSILEFAGSIPEDYFLRDGLKGMIRKAVEPLLPPIVTQNPSKSGIVFPVAEIVDTDLKKLIDRDLGFLDKYGLFTKPAREMLKEHKELINRRILWALWSLGTWLRYFKPDL
jgi:asparagine synthase (glutamine-hydrolysing)